MDRSHDWLRQAERDVDVARQNAASGYHEWAAFAAQQAAEKAAKALVQSVHGSAKGHSVTGILRQISTRVAVPDFILDAARELDQVYVTARYPNGFASGSPSDYFTPATSARLLKHAETLADFCRSQIS